MLNKKKLNYWIEKYLYINFSETRPCCYTVCTAICLWTAIYLIPLHISGASFRQCSWYYMSSRFSSNSEANASELLENLKEMFLCFHGDIYQLHDSV